MAAATANGPPAVPRSESTRQTPRNGTRVAGGAKSAPSVITTPLESPLPAPSSIATSASVSVPCVSGMIASPTDMITRHGIAAALRPQRSMTLPPG